MKKFYIILLIVIASIAKQSQAQPTITTFTPTSGPVGTAVTITGTNFNTTPANNIVFFGATKATVSTATTTSLTVAVPVDASYQYITVTDLTTGLTGYSAQPFIVTFTCGGIINSSSFAPQVDFTVVSAPQGVAIGDLDGDGKSEIAVSNYTDTTVSVFRNTGNNGTISFGPKMDFTIGYSPVSIAMQDLDGDGKLDLIAANSSWHTFSVLRNISTNGTISFDNRVDFTTENNPRFFAIGDLDGDGKPDLVVPNPYINTASIFRNTSTTGTISFAAKSDFTTGNSPEGIAIGDLDGDGKPELALMNSADNTISAFRNTSTSGAISFAAKVDSTTGQTPRSIAMGDLDTDGKLDIAVLNSDGTASVLRNTGTIGTLSFSSKVDFASGGDHSLVLGDIDGDGKPDMVLTDGNSVVSVIKNTGASGTVSFASNVAFLTTGYNSFSLAIGDLNGDGKTDMAVASYSDNTVSVLKNLLGANIAAMTSVTAVNSCSGVTVGFPFLSDMPASYRWIASDNPNTSGESMSIQTASTLADIITNNTTTPQTVTYTVTPTALTSTCPGSPQTVAVTVNPLPVVSFSGLKTKYCFNASVQTLTGSPFGGTYSGAGISGNSFTPSVASVGSYTITYNFTDGNNCTNSSSHTTEVLPLPIAPPICMVTTDSYSINNIIYWDKTPYSNVDSFIVYRETISNTYKRIGAVAMNSLSLFVDTTRHLYFPFTGNPNAGTYRYKLQIRDTCGNYSPLSPHHNTIYVTQTGGTFNWNDYKIEGQATPIPQLTSYYLYRDNNGTGVWVLVNGVSGSQLTINDPDYALYPNANWRIETQWSIACTPTRSTEHTARSNIKGHTVGIATMNEPVVTVAIYPNPYSGNTTITYTLNKKSDVSIEVYNTIGQKMETPVNAAQAAGKYKYNFSAKQKGNATGIYFVKIVVDGQITMKRIVETD